MQPRQSTQVRRESVYCHVVSQPLSVPSREVRVIDTRGDEPFTAVYVAVVAIEGFVLAALWLFSRYFSG